MSDAVQQIKEKLDIIDVIAPYVELKKAGKNYKGKSPFTTENTPSFYVSPDRGMYYCFSTSQGGDMFTFIQAMEGIDFKGALQQLAQKAGVELVPEDPAKRTERDRWYAALEEATVLYESTLHSTPDAAEYLEQRGVSQETVHAWRIGYAPGPPKRGWRETKAVLEEKGYGTKELLTVGLIKEASGGKQPFDVFRDRVVFPLCDPGGRVVAFSGRILAKDSDAPKYVNSPETPLYKKSELLFGYHKAKDGIRKLGFSLIVEGQFDVVMAHQAGYTNAVAVSGTALTSHHVHLLERLSDRVVLALDADRAGIAAMKKGAEVMLVRGIDVKVAHIPDGQDPADLITTDAHEFKRIIGTSVHVIEFLLQLLTRQEKDPRTLKLLVRSELLPFVLLLPNRIDQEHFVGVIAEKIGSTTEAIRFEIDRLRDERQSVSGRYHDDVRHEKTSTPVPVEASSSVSGAYAHLEAIIPLLPKEAGDIIAAELAKIRPPTESPSPSQQAKLTFTLEDYIRHMPPQALQEDIIARLNYVKTKSLQIQLGQERKLLHEAESASEDITQHLISIQAIQEQMRQPGLTIDIFAQQD